MRILNSCEVLQDSIVQTGVGASRSKPHTFYARLLVFDKTSAASFCSCKLLGRSDGRVLLPVLTCSPIFLYLWTAVSWRWLYFPPISELGALIVYIRQWRVQGRGLGLNPHPWAWYFTKLYYLRKGDQLFSHTFCLLICRCRKTTFCRPFMHYV